jgi:hypothetical protein
MIKNKPEEELRQLAIDLYHGKVFTSLDPGVKSAQDLQMIFMPLLLGAFKDLTPADFKNIGMLYEYYDKAGPRSINGFPNFTSFTILSVHDLEILRDILEQYQKTQKQFKDGKGEE